MRKSKEDLVIELGQSFYSLCEVASSIENHQFNISKENKWTAAENIQHLVNATKMTSLAYTLPKFISILLYGKPGRTSHGFGKIVENYQKKLESGAKASGVYVPKKADYDKKILTAKLNDEGKKLVQAISNKWSDEQLDNYHISHPILGLLTLRELGYFTLYHNGHHQSIIQKYYANL